MPEVLEPFPELMALGHARLQQLIQIWLDEPFEQDFSLAESTHDRPQPDPGTCDRHRCAEAVKNPSIRLLRRVAVSMSYPLSIVQGCGRGLRSCPLRL
jgi:hypothetical protein